MRLEVDRLRARPRPVAESLQGTRHRKKQHKVWQDGAIRHEVALDNIIFCKTMLKDSRGYRIDWRHADLSGADLSGANPLSQDTTLMDFGGLPTGLCRRPAYYRQLRAWPDKGRPFRVVRIRSTENCGSRNSGLPFVRGKTSLKKASASVEPPKFQILTSRSGRTSDGDKG